MVRETRGDSRDRMNPTDSEVKVRLRVERMSDGDVVEVDSIDSLVAVESTGTVSAKLFYLEEVDED